MNMVLRPTFGRISHNFSQNQNVLFFKNLHFWLLSEILKSDCNFKISFMMYLTIINTPPVKKKMKNAFIEYHIFMEYNLLIGHQVQKPAPRSPSRQRTTSASGPATTMDTSNVKSASRKTFPTNARNCQVWPLNHYNK